MRPACIRISPRGPPPFGPFAPLRLASGYTWAVRMPRGVVDTPSRAAHRPGHRRTPGPFVTEAQTIEVWIALASLCVAGGLTPLLLRWEGRAAAALFGAFVGVLLLRGLLVEPGFIHASHHGPALLDDAWLNWGWSSRNYGATASLINGAAVRVFAGSSLNIVAWIHQVVGVATLLLAGACTARWSSRRAAFGFVVAAGALYPPLARVSFAADGHPLALFFLWLGIFAFDSAVREERLRRWGWLLVGTAATMLAASTRQIFLAFVLIPAFLAFAQAPRKVLRSPPFYATVLLVLGFVALRAGIVLPERSQAMHLAAIPIRLSDPVVVGHALLMHPWLDVVRFALLLLPLSVVGAVAAARSRGGWALLVVTLFTFLLTLAFYEGQNVSLTFRLPMVMYGIVLAGIGAATLSTRLSERFDARRVQAVAVGVFLVVPLLLPGRAVLSKVLVQTHEYEYIAAHADALPEEFDLVFTGERPPAPSTDFPRHLVSPDGGLRQTIRRPSDVDRISEYRPLVFLDGIECHAVGVLEAVGQTTLNHRAVFATRGNPEGRALIVAAIHDRLPANAVVPEGRRPACEMLLRGARRITPEAEIPGRPHDPPFGAYTAESIPIAFYELDPETVRAYFNDVAARESTTGGPRHEPDERRSAGSR